MRNWVLVTFLASVLAAGAFGAATPLGAQSTPNFTYDGGPFAAQVVDTKDDDPAAVVTNLSFAGSRGGTRITATLVTPKRPGKRAAILWVHWLGDPPTTNRTEFLPDAVALARNGATSLLIDAMWSAPKWYDVRTPDSDYDNSIHQVTDLRRALDFLLTQPGIARDRVAYVGHDFGAMYGAVMAGLDPRPRYYVLMAGTTKFSDWYLYGKQPSDKAAFIAQMAPLDPGNFLPKSKGEAFLFQFSSKDEYVSAAHANEFAGYAPQGAKTMLKFYDTGHALATAQVSNDRRNWLVNSTGLFNL